MANTYTQIFYHIVFSTKTRVPCIGEERRKDLYHYIWGIHKSLKCHLYRLGGVEDHVHILTAIHPTVALADYVGKNKGRFHQLDSTRAGVCRLARLAGRLRGVHRLG